MTIKICFFSILTLLSSFFFKTTETKTEGVITYSYQNAGPLKTETKLYFKGQKAKYERHHEKATATTDEGYQIKYAENHFDWYFEKESLYMFVEKDGYPNFFAKWKTNQIEWEITDETQVISGLLTKKAITKSVYHEEEAVGILSSDYGKAIAWFTTDIPINYGPDGYNGLPGLIVKLEYTGFKNSHKTVLKSIEYKKVADWNLPNVTKMLEVNQDQAYNWYNYGQKWFNKRAKELGL